MNTELTTQTAEDLTAEEMAETIRDFTREAFAALNEQREREYAAACAPLDRELADLAAESDEIHTQALAVIARMGSAERVMQYKYDLLVNAGKIVEAQAKLAELEKIKAGPAQIEERRREIEERCAQIEADKRTALRRGAEDFLKSSIKLIRGTETGLTSLLDATRDTLNNLETMLGKVIYQVPMLTADERSNEWNTLHRLYGGRVR